LHLDHTPRSGKQSWLASHNEMIPGYHHGKITGKSVICGKNHALIMTISLMAKPFTEQYQVPRRQN